MSLYDDVVTDLPGVTNISDPVQTTDNTNSASSWANANFKLMQMQVQAAKKRQSLTKAKPAFIPKSINSIAPVIDLSDKRGKPQLQLKKDPEPYGTIYSTNQMPPASGTLGTTKSFPKSSGEIRFDTITGKMERVDEVQSASIFSNSTEEYDPMRPNEYEKLAGDLSSSRNRTNKENDKRRDRRRSNSRRRKHSRSRSRGRKERRRRYSSDESRSRSRSRRKSRSRDKKSSRRRHSSSSDDSDGYSRKRRHDDSRSGSSKKSESEGSSNGTAKRAMNAFAPPPILLEDTFDLNAEEKKAEPALPTKSLFGSLKAEKMMAKMGYKEGDGLGRNKQGMSIALQVEKTGKRIGRIIHEKDVVETPPQEPLPPVVQAPAIAMPPPAVGIPADVMKNMSKVILLTNMVGPGDVDEELEAETKEECAKYGEVNKCLIFELPNRSPEEAVRIFLEFKTLPSAIKALTDLNGRFFGGRSVKATFYNFDKFKRLELSD